MKEIASFLKGKNSQFISKLSKSSSKLLEFENTICQQVVARDRVIHKIQSYLSILK